MRMLCLALMLSALFPALNSMATELHLAEDGRALLPIVVAERATAPEKHAAAELQRFLAEATGAEFELLAQAPADGAAILVGPDAAADAGLAFDPKGLGADGIEIRVEDGRLLLAGGRPRGTLYAVFEFLQRCVGCRWWSSQVTHVPARPDLLCEIENIRYSPPFEYRYSFWTDAFDADWSVRNKSNGYHGLGAEQYGGYMTHGGVHTFFALIPPDKYFDDHPEWFSLINGERVHKSAQLCLTNADMRRELIRNLKAEIRSKPDQRVFSVSQNDWFRNCQCPQCRQIDEREGSPAGSLLDFVNAVAEEIEAEFPEVSISTLAYQYSRKPPLHIRPRDNVIIQLCSIECSFAVPLADQRNASFRDDIVGWSQICERLYVWDYGGNYRHHFIPHPNLFVLGPNVRFFAEHNVVGLFAQGTYTSLGTEFAELRAWVQAQLLWNPELDDRALIAEFCRGYYGAAADDILEYIELIHAAAAQAGEYANCLPEYSYNFPYLDFKLLDRAYRIMTAACAAVADDPQLRARAEMASLPVLYAFMWKWDALRAQAAAAGAEWPLDEDIERVAEYFITTAKANGATRANEWYEGFGLVQQAVDKAQPQAPAPANADRNP
jgi:hypothetical protein